MKNGIPWMNIPGLCQSVDFPDFEVCWAGPLPYLRGFCFGSEQGSLILTDEAGKPYGRPDPVSDAQEAINGVAFSQGWLAVSTRADVNIMPFHPDVPDKPQGLVYPFGADGVAVAASGRFVVPLGQSGILFINPGAGPNEPTTIGRAQKQEMYFYRVLPLLAVDGGDVIISAARRGGLGISEFRQGQKTHKLNIVSFDNLDIVDVCSIGAEGHIHAVAALARDGTLIFLADVLRDKTPQTIRFKSVQGTAYRLLSANGNLLLLSSNGLYIFARLAAQFLEGAVFGTFRTPILSIPMEAVDANIVNDRWLLVVTANHVLKLDLDLIQQHAPANDEEQLPETHVPRWQHGGEQPLQEMAGVG